MELQLLNGEFTVCKTACADDINLSDDFVFVGKTDEELSLVCRADSVPVGALEREDGFCGFRITGVLDFSLIGILSKISAVLAENKIGIFVVSTFNTDYIFVKAEKLDDAVSALKSEGYVFV